MSGFWRVDFIHSPAGAIASKRRVLRISRCIDALKRRFGELARFSSALSLSLLSQSLSVGNHQSVRYTYDEYSHLVVVMHNQRLHQMTQFGITDDSVGEWYYI